MALGFRNLAAVWQNYRDAGARCLIIPSLLDSDDQAELRKAVPGADIYVVRLVAPLAVNHDRIRGRRSLRTRCAGTCSGHSSCTKSWQSSRWNTPPSTPRADCLTLSPGKSSPAGASCSAADHATVSG